MNEAKMHWKLMKGLVCLLFAVATVSVFGQTARFTGQVTDPQGAAIPSAQVQIVNLETLVSRKIKTDTTGNYSVPFLPAGKYQITVTAEGFGPSHSGDLPITAGQAFIYNVQLGVANAKTSVTVEGQGAAQIETENAEVSGTITGDAVNCAHSGSQQPDRAGRRKDRRHRQREIQRQRRPRSIQRLRG
jgi:hypothetical protein